MRTLLTGMNSKDFIKQYTDQTKEMVDERIKSLFTEMFNNAMSETSCKIVIAMCKEYGYVKHATEMEADLATCLFMQQIKL